jgi:hypothetical protein
MPPVFHHPGGGVPIEGTPAVTIVETVYSSPTPARESEPMWPVVGTEIADRVSDPANGGYNFEDGEVVAFNDDDADVYFESEDSVLHAADDCDIQDLGPSMRVREDLRVDRGNWDVRRALAVQRDHQYAIWRWNGDVVRLLVREIGGGTIVFDWMPARPIKRTGPEGPVFGR